MEQNASGLWLRIAAAALGVFGALSAGLSGLIAVKGGRLDLTLGFGRAWLEVGPVSPGWGWFGIAACLTSIVGVLCLARRPRTAGVLLLMAAGAAAISGLAFSGGVIALAAGGTLGLVSSLNRAVTEDLPDPFWDRSEDGDVVASRTEQALPADGVRSEQQGSGAVHR
jgi:hypothetical protein